MKEDFINSINKSTYMNDVPFKDILLAKLIRTIVRMFSPLLWKTNMMPYKYIKNN